jgi:hypothetical protein
MTWTGGVSLDNEVIVVRDEKVTSMSSNTKLKIHSSGRHASCTVDGYVRIMHEVMSWPNVCSKSRMSMGVSLLVAGTLTTSTKAIGMLATDRIKLP